MCILAVLVHAIPTVVSGLVPRSAAVPPAAHVVLLAIVSVLALRFQDAGQVSMSAISRSRTVDWWSTQSLAMRKALANELHRSATKLAVRITFTISDDPGARPKN